MTGARVGEVVGSRGAAVGFSVAGAGAGAGAGGFRGAGVFGCFVAPGLGSFDVFVFGRVLPFASFVTIAKSVEKYGSLSFRAFVISICLAFPLFARLYENNDKSSVLHATITDSSRSFDDDDD